MVRTSHTPARGAQLIFEESVHATVEGRQDDFFVLRFDRDVQSDAGATRPRAAAAVYRACGRFDRCPSLSNRLRGAPRCGCGADCRPSLHAGLVDSSSERGIEFAYVTLHVGAGTFQPVRAERIAEHRMHSERYEISEPAAQAINAARAARRRVIAVGTTSLRALESAAEGSRRTSSFRRPRNRALHHAGLSLSTSSICC